VALFGEPYRTCQMNKCSRSKAFLELYISWIINYYGFATCIARASDPIQFFLFLREPSVLSSRLISRRNQITWKIQCLYYMMVCTCGWRTYLWMMHRSSNDLSSLNCDWKGSGGAAIIVKWKLNCKTRILWFLVRRRWIFKESCWLEMSRAYKDLFKFVRVYKSALLLGFAFWCNEFMYFVHCSEEPLFIYR